MNKELANITENNISYLITLKKKNRITKSDYEAYEAKINRRIESISNKSMLKLSLSPKEGFRQLKEEEIVKICKILNVEEQLEISLKEENLSSLRKFLDELFKLIDKDQNQYYKKIKTNNLKEKRLLLISEYDHKNFFRELDEFNRIMYLYFTKVVISLNDDIFEEIIRLLKVVNSNSNRYTLFTLPQNYTFDELFKNLELEAPNYSNLEEIDVLPLYCIYYHIIADKVQMIKSKSLFFKIENEIINFKSIKKLPQKQNYLIKDLSEYLDVKINTLQNQFNEEEELKSFKTGRKYIIPREQILIVLMKLLELKEKKKFDFKRNLAILTNRLKVYNRLKELFDIFYEKNKSEIHISSLDKLYDSAYCLWAIHQEDYQNLILLKNNQLAYGDEVDEMFKFYNISYLLEKIEMRPASGYFVE